MTLPVTTGSAAEIKPNMKTYDQSEQISSSTQPAVRSVRFRLRCGMPGALLLTSMLLWTVPAQAGVAGVGGKRGVDVMQVNLYVGGGIDRAVALDPSDPNYYSELVATVTGIYYEILASQPPVRLQGVANQIAVRMPDLVSVEEASLIRNESPGDLVHGGSNPATNVVFDYLQILTNALAAQGAHYGVAAVTYGFDAEMPMLNLQTGTIDDVRLTDREAILVRTDLPPGQFHVSNPQNANFSNVVVTATGLPLLYGWCSVDVSVRGREFRYICPHLTVESAPEIQALEVQELLAGPADSNLPILIVGDFNADPYGRDGSFAYDLFPAAGYSDAWAVLHPDDSAGGLTWGHDEFLADPGLSFNRRIDLMFYRGGGLQPIESDVAELRLDRNQAPLWASDHAALATEFGLR